MSAEIQAIPDASDGVIDIGHEALDGGIVFVHEVILWCNRQPQ